jgi:hypothetical protein
MPPAELKCAAEHAIIKRMLVRPQPAALLFLLALVFILVPAGSARQASATASRGKIIFVNVEQGDGVVMKFGSTVVVSDVGTPKRES